MNVLQLSKFYPPTKGGIEFYFDSYRFRYRDYSLGRNNIIKIWNGNEFVEYGKYFTHEVFEGLSIGVRPLQTGVHGFFSVDGNVFQTKLLSQNGPRLIQGIIQPRALQHGQGKTTAIALQAQVSGRVEAPPQ